jgi:molecular chaperone DnaJ
MLTEVVKIKNAGIPHISKPSLRGEHVVVMNIKTPTHISNEEKALYQKLYEIHIGKSANKSVKEKLKGVFK